MRVSVFDQFPRLETARLLLRAMQEDDGELVFQFNSDAEALRFVPRVPFVARSQGQEKALVFRNAFQEKKGIWWTFVHKESGEALGYGGLFDFGAEGTRAEIGYGTLPRFWGKGYVGEAVAELVRFGFDDLQLHRIFGRVDPGNMASARILEKLGFENEGLLRHDDCAGGKYFDMHVWGRLAAGGLHE